MEEIRSGAAKLSEEAVDFFSDLIRIPSPSGGEEKVVAAIERRMHQLGFDEVLVDPFGNILGRIGHGKRVIAYDAHVDTVGVGNRSLWNSDPFGAEIVDGILYGRGASDQKGGMAALVYAGRLMQELGIGEDVTIWIVGSVLEEDCDGLCWHYLLEEKLIDPEVVVLTEPTNLNVYRGQRGRMEIEIVTRGISCHGSAPERGKNAIYSMAPILAEIERMNDRFAAEPFLGPGSVAVSEIRSTAPSLCAVADSCTIHLDRRLTVGETDRTAIAEIEAIADRNGQTIEIHVPEFRRPSHTGLVYPMRQYFPAWVLSEGDPFLQKAQEARTQALGGPGSLGRWTFSTNGVATRGIHGVPTFGFGPASEEHAHAPTDQCPVDHIESAIAFYVAYAGLLATEV